MTDFGIDNPREMPLHFFYGALRVNYDTAVRADSQRQNCSICPRYWYIDTVFKCERCGEPFVFSADEQRVWYEEYRFWVDSIPRHCVSCRKDLRTLRSVRQQYDQTVAQTLQHGNLGSLRQLAALIDLLYELGGELPARINENRRRLAKQIAQAEAGAGNREPLP